MKRFYYLLGAFGCVTSSVYADCKDTTVFCNLTDQKTAPDENHPAHSVRIGCKAGGLFNMGSCNPIPEHMSQAQQVCNEYGGVNRVDECGVDWDSFNIASNPSPYVSKSPLKISPWSLRRRR